MHMIFGNSELGNLADDIFKKVEENGFFFDSHLQRDLTNTILLYLRLIKIDWFLGGSRRFGYNHKASDIDILVYAPEEEDQKNISHVLGGIGLPFLEEVREEGYENSSYLCSLADLYHVVVFTDYSEFMRIKKEHEKIKRMLEKNMYLTDFSRSLRIAECPGSRVYSALAGMVS